MAITTGDIIRVALQWFVDGANEIVNVHHFEVDDAGATTGDLDFMTQLAATLAAELYDNILTQMADDILGAAVQGFNVTKTETLPVVDNVIDGTQAGGDAYARQITALVYLNANVPRRQGRSYLPPFTEAAIGDDGGWVSGTVAALADYAVKLTGIITDGDIAVHRVITHPDGSVPLDPTFAGFGAFPRTQRRRTPGFGS